jgi:DNA-binding NtrC family response regulator
MFKKPLRAGYRLIWRTGNGWRFRRRPMARMGGGDRPRKAAADMTLKNMIEAYERQLIESALEATSGNQRRAAAQLGVLPTTLHEKMKRLGLLRRQAETAEALSA